MTGVIAALLPLLFWERGPETADQLKQAGITRIAVPAPLESGWKSQPGFTVRVADPQSATKLLQPTIRFRANEAAATRVPWMDLNAYRFLRNPAAAYIYDAPGAAAGLAAAEAFLFGGQNVLIRTNDEGLAPLGTMLAYLSRLDLPDLPPVADIGFIDDGSPQAGEVINLLVRRNLLVRLTPKPDPALKLNVPFGSAKYPASANPSDMAQSIRAELSDEKRSLRIYGSEVTIVRLSGDRKRRRVELLNYATRPVYGIRVRVLGRYLRHQLKLFGSPSAELVDYRATADATEFTIPELKSYAAVEMSAP